MTNSITVKKSSDSLQNLKMTNPSTTLHVMYGSRTGNSKSAAMLAWKYAKHLGIESHLIDMKIFQHKELRQIKNLLIVVSTHGEGDPPAVVENFYRFIHQREAPSMEGVKFSVLALGDSSYKDYCKTGWDFRNRLLELGAQEINSIVECDIDYEENAKKWVFDSVSFFERILPKTELNGEKEFAFEINKPELEQGNSYYAKVLEKKMLTSAGYEKKTLHLTLSMKNFGTEFYPGDSFGVYTPNSKLLVDNLLKTMNFDGTRPIKSGKELKLLKEILVHDYELTLVTPVVVNKYAKLTGNKSISNLAMDEKLLEAFCETHDVLDLVSLYPAHIKPEDFLGVLRKLNPRLYSVASSPLVYPDELHLTIGIMEYELNKRKHKGVCSTFFYDILEEGKSVPLVLEPNERFRLPQDDNLPVIMIATGTGIAPFRGFLQERNHKKAKGQNWLFFGDRHIKSDFLYGNELNEYHETGLLTKMNLAFSRDQKEKDYVQHHLLRNSKEIFHWINDLDAVVYLCGNKRTMGHDVKEALLNLISNEGSMPLQQANDYLQKMIQNRKFLTDVY